MHGAGPIFTIGHSTHSLERFLSLLGAHGVECLVDVRLIPRSRRMPHFSSDSLAAALPLHDVRYVHMKSLGGRRRPRPGSPHRGWRVEGFQGYADHMEGGEFRAALAELERIAAETRTAIMCAEGLWWRCHRRLIADALVARGWPVTHIGPDARGELHTLTPFAVAEGDRLVYPAPQTSLEVPD